MFNMPEKTGLHVALYSGGRTGYAPVVPTGEASRGAAAIACRLELLA